MRFRVVVICLVFALIAGATCSVAFADFRVTGSSTIFPIVQSAAIPFQEKTGIHIELKGGGSENGIAALKDNRAEVTMVSRDLQSSDPNGLQAYVIGYDGIALIANQAVSADRITTPEVIDIYTGNMVNWARITGKDQPITLISKHEGHGTKTMFDMFFNLAGRISPDAVLFNSNNESLAMVSSDPNAIGYVSIGSAEHGVALKLRLKIFKLNGIEATSENVASGIYPLRRTLNLVTFGEPGPEVAAFVSFMQGPAGQQFVAQHHFVPLSGVMP